MDELNRCPNCHQELIKVGNYLICTQHGQVSLKPKVVAPLRIFLSYGHDHNDELGSLIKTDLEKNGLDVWYDKNEIKMVNYNSV